MSKDAYYFPHDYNAKDDPKCERLLYEMGQEGYGIFWTLIEVLRAQPDYTYPIANLPIIARKYNADEDKMRKVIYDYELFVVIDDKIFYSDSLNRRMEVLDNRRRRQSDGGKNGNAKRWAAKKLSLTESLTESLTDRIKENKSKVNHKRESKEKSAVKPCTDASKRTAFVAPTLEEFKEYFQSIGGTATEAECSFDYYTSKGWKVGCAPMIDWRSAARNWNRRSKCSRYASNTPNAAPENTSATYQILTMENCQD